VFVDLAGGSAGSISDDSSTTARRQLAYRVAHGVLMLAAFVLLMPAAALLARHKWLFGDKKVRPCYTVKVCDSFQRGSRDWFRNCAARLLLGAAFITLGQHGQHGAWQIQF
jgi:hypothetical protein